MALGGQGLIYSEKKRETILMLLHEKDVTGGAELVPIKLPINKQARRERRIAANFSPTFTVLKDTDNLTFQLNLFSF